MFVSGDKIVLVDDRWPAFIAYYDNVPVKNRTYTVRDVRLARTDITDPNPETAAVAITLEGLTNGPDPHYGNGLVELAFKGERFRKIDDLKEKRQKKETLHQGSFF